MIPSATESAQPLRRANNDASARIPSNSQAKRALCIGIDTYSAAPLQAAVVDAIRWADALAILGFEVRLLKDRRATCARIGTAIVDLLEATADGGQAVIQFAGHATQLRDSTATSGGDLLEALVPFDYVSAGCIVCADLAALLRSHAERLSITLLLDCSHPGSVAYPATALEWTDDAGVAKPGEVTELRRRFLPFAEHRLPAKFTRAARSARGHTATGAPVASPWVHVAAARSGEFAYETPAGGDFSLAALRHLPIAVKERWLPARFLDAVRIALPASRAQTPQLRPMTGPRRTQPLFGNSPHEPPADAVASVKALSLRELIRAVEALADEVPRSQPERR